GRRRRGRGAAAGSLAVGHSSCRRAGPGGAEPAACSTGPEGRRLTLAPRNRDGLRLPRLLGEELLDQRYAVGLRRLTVQEAWRVTGSLHRDQHQSLLP